jgi:hypothetical protein
VKRVLAAAALAVTAVPSAAHANGGNSHAWISVHALDHLPDGELKRMLSRPELEAMLINGSVFPDGGYVVDDDYGEMAHWEPFVEAYVRWIRDAFPAPLTDGEASEHVAFLLGAASHGMADQVFDATFMDAARIHDAANWSETLLMDFDTATDVMLVDDLQISFLDVAPWVPSEELSALYHDALGYDIAAGTLDSGQDLLHRLVLNYAATATPTKVQQFREQYPWASEHLMEEERMGSPPCEGEIVADYWLAIWDRLHEVSGPQNWVIQTYPRDGAGGMPTDAALVEARAIVVFGHGIQRAQLEGRVTVTDSTGAAHAVNVDTQWGSSEANLIKIAPVEDWPADETLTVTIAAGLELNDGTMIDEPFTYSFSTAAEPVEDPSSDPTPHEGEPDVGRPPPREAGCCSTGGGGGGAGFLAFCVLALVSRPRRARS